MVLGDNLWSWTVLVSTVLVMQHKLILLVHSHRLGRREKPLVLDILVL